MMVQSRDMNEKYDFKANAEKYARILEGIEYRRVTHSKYNRRGPRRGDMVDYKLWGAYVNGEFLAYGTTRKNAYINARGELSFRDYAAYHAQAANQETQ